MEVIGGEALERCILGGSRIKLPSWQRKICGRSGRTGNQSRPAIPVLFQCSLFPVSLPHTIALQYPVRLAFKSLHTLIVPIVQVLRRQPIILLPSINHLPSAVLLDAHLLLLA